ncbi:MAG: hypothetical protein ACLFN5_00985 [bacterium]
MNSSGFARFTVYSLLLLVVVTFSSSCVPGVDSPADRQLRLEVNDIANEIEQGMNGEDVNRLLAVVHDNYSPSKGDLRAELRDIFRDHSQITLELYAVNFNRANGEVNLTVNWNRRWREDGEIEPPTSGQTTFRLRKDSSDYLKIISQRGDILLGKDN